jgi:hypothetical protein
VVFLLLFPAVSDSGSSDLCLLKLDLYLIWVCTPEMPTTLEAESGGLRILGQPVLLGEISHFNKEIKR